MTKQIISRKNIKLIKDLLFQITRLIFSKLQNNRGNLIMQADRTNQSTQVESHQNEHFKKHHKSTKKTKYVPVDEQVVFHLIDSAHLLSTLKKDHKLIEGCKKTIETKDQYKQRLQLMQKIGMNKTQIMQLLSTIIKPIPFDGINDIKMKLRASLRKVYMSKKVLRELEGEVKFRDYSLNIISETISSYLCLSELLRQCSVPTPVQQGFYHQYSMLWIEIIDILKKQLQAAQLNAIKQAVKQKFLGIWEEIPHLSLSKHLKDFDLRLSFGSLNEDEIIPRLNYLLVDNKIQQCCTYYEIYLLARMQQNEIQKNSSKLREFEDFVLIPKITKSDHIFSSHVLSLFKANQQLKQRLLNSAQLQPSIGLRVVDLLKQDGRNYYNIYMYILRQHYKSIIYDHKTWYMVEDKLSFNKNFIEWFAEDMVKVLKGEMEKNDDRIHKIAKDLKGIENIEDLELSILERNHIIDLQHSRLKHKAFTRIKNPLYESDRFDCAQLLIHEISPEVSQTSVTKYLRFEQFGIYEDDINFIDSIDEKFNHMRDTLLNHVNQPIGFDTEFRCVATKYEQQGVSLIQLSTNEEHFVVDFLKLQHDKQFNDFIIELLCNESYLKVGHTISSDIRYLRMTLKIPDSREIKNFIDITVMFKLLHSNEKFSSLTFMCQKFLNRKLSKYEQRGNWIRRPLKKTQLHYGALDAFSCVLIYDKIKDDYYHFLKHGKPHKIASNPKHSEQTPHLNHETTQQQLETVLQTPKQSHLIAATDKQSNLIGDTYRSEQLTYNIKYEFFLTSKQPKFLVDNMLKKLSNVMRNCGIDAQYIAVRDYDLAIEIAEKDQRIILTRDTKFFQRKDNRVPIYLIKQRTQSDKMFEQIKSYFKFDLSNCKTLSRCVKCNGPELVIIPKEQAKKDIKFKYEDSTVEQFWRCTKCRQIYWEGGMFQRAKQKYTNLKKLISQQI